MVKAQNKNGDFRSVKQHNKIV